MSVIKERRNIESKMEESLKDGFSKYRFESYKLNSIDKEDDYYKALECFKYLYQLGGDAHIYLWNSMWNPFKFGVEVDATDFSKDELDFIKSISTFYAQECEKYGERYSENTNINSQFESNRLIIKPYDGDLNDKYQDFFLNNHDECERFYGEELDVYEVKRCCNQKERPLSFALITKDTNEFIGSVALSLMRSDCLYNIEYFVFPKYRKCGYAYEAMIRLIEATKNKELKILKETIRRGVYEVKDANIKCIEARINTNNLASLSLANKCGFKLMGILPYFDKDKDMYVDGEQYDLMI